MKLLKQRKGITSLVTVFEIFFAVPIIAFSLIILYAWMKNAGVDRISSSVYGSALEIELDYNLIFNLKNTTYFKNPAHLFMQENFNIKNYELFKNSMERIYSSNNLIYGGELTYHCKSYEEKENKLLSDCINSKYEYQLIFRHKSYVYTTRDLFISGNNHNILKLEIYARVYPTIFQRPPDDVLIL